MEIEDIKKVIDKQSTIQKKIYQNEEWEAYEIEACEIIAYLAILDFWKLKYPLSNNLLRYQTNTEEDWECINHLFNDYVLEKDTSMIESEILYLVDYFYKKFYPTSSKENYNEDFEEYSLGHDEPF